MRNATVKLGGQSWRIRFVSKSRLAKLSRGVWGLCIPSEKVIYIRNDLSQKDTVDTAIHEMSHAQEEAIVNWRSTELANGLVLTGLIDDAPA